MSKADKPSAREERAASGYARQADAIDREDAARLARDAQKQALRDEWRDYISRQPSEEELPTSSITSAVYRGALVTCLKIAQGDVVITEVEHGSNGDAREYSRPVSHKDRIRACEAIFRLRMEEARLLAEMNGLAAPQPQVQAATLPGLTDDEKVAFLRSRIKLAGGA